MDSISSSFWGGGVAGGGTTAFDLGLVFNYKITNGINQFIIFKY